MSSRRSRSGGTSIETVLIRKNRSWRRRPSRRAASGLRFVDEMRRKSTGTALAAPTRRTARSSRTRRSFAWSSAGISVISSRRSEPPSASSSRPVLSLAAPVKAPQVGVLDDDPPVVERAPHETEELVRIERLLENMEGSGPFGRLHRLAHRAVRGDHDHLDRGVASPELPREVEAVAVREHQVHDRGLGLALREGGERVPHVPGRAHRVALALEREPEPVGDRLLVVDHEDHAAVRLHGATTGSRTCTRVPWPSRLWRVSSPPCSWTTERAIDMPSPVPSGLVV